MKDLFQKHLNRILSEVSNILTEENLDSLVVESGFPDYYFRDDQPTPFRSNPYFLYFCPDPGPGHTLFFKKGDAKPTLYFHQPDDFWHEVSQLTGSFWEQSFDLKTINSFEKA